MTRIEYGDAEAAAFQASRELRVVTVEPSAAMRARSGYRYILAGSAPALPLAPAAMDGAWLSTVIHHLPDLPAAARELRRVFQPGVPVRDHRFSSRRKAL
jgi:ubiquinone/menaquinone biosynthesis C-methylase UbiE